jgi:hypothetical protein
LLEDRKQERLRKVAPEQRERATQALAGITAAFVPSKFVRRI